MAQLMGAESMHNTRSSLCRRPGYAVRAGPTNSRRASEVTCIVCGKIADSSALKCSHHYCGRCYVKLYVPDRGTFVCKAEHCRSRDKSSESWITWFSSGYYSGSPPQSAYQSRNSNFSQRSRAALSAFLKKVLCLDTGDKDEEELDAEALVPLRNYETVAAGNYFAYDTKLYDMTSKKFSSAPNLRDKNLHDDKLMNGMYRPRRMEIVTDVGRPARPLEPEIVIRDNPFVQHLGESDSESELGAVGGAVGQQERKDSYSNPGEHYQSHLNNIPEVRIHEQRRPHNPTFEFIRHVGARPLAPPDHGQSARRPQYPYSRPYQIIVEVDLCGSSTSQFSGPNSVKFDTNNSSIIIVDTQNDRLKVCHENMEFSHLFGGSAPCLNGGQFCRPLSCAPYEGRVIVADSGHSQIEGRVQVVKNNGQFVRQIGRGQIVQPTCLAIKGRVLTVVDCNRLKQFRLSEEDWGDDEYIGEVDNIHVHGDIQCICKPNERTLIVADRTHLHIIENNMEMSIITLDRGGVPRCMRTDSSGFLLILYADRFDVYTPAPECQFYCTFPLAGINIDVCSMDILPDGRMILCGGHGFVELKFMPWPTSPVIPPSENLESSL